MPIQFKTCLCIFVFVFVSKNSKNIKSYQKKNSIKKENIVYIFMKMLATSFKNHIDNVNN